MEEKKIFHIFKAIFTFVLVLIFAAGMSSSVCAADLNTHKQKIVRIGYYEDNNGFQLGFSDGERKSGYAYEYYQEISKYAGWKYEYVYGSWGELYDKLLSGEVDIMAGVSKTDERINQMLFPDNVMGTEAYYIFVPTNYTQIKGSDKTTLNGKKIGVNDKSLMLTLFLQYVKDNNIDCKILTYDGHFSCANALKNGEIDGYIITDNYVVEGVKPVIKIGASDIYFAISKRRMDLIKDINYAQEQILAASPYYTTYLQSKYFDRSVLRQALNDNELSWLQHKKHLNIGYLDDKMPYSGTDVKTGAGAGLIATMQSKISTFLGTQVRLKAYGNTDELLKALKSSEIDAAFPFYGDTWTAEQNDIYLTDEIASDRMIAVYYGDYDVSLLKKTAVVTNGFGQVPYLQQYYPNAEMIYYDNIAACLAAVESGEASCIIADNNIMQRYFSETPKNASMHYAYLEEPISFCMAVSNNGTILQSILNKTIAHIQSSELTDAITRNTYAPARYTFIDFIEHNVFALITFLGLIVLLLIMGFYIYRKNSIRHQLQLTVANRAKSDFLSRMSHDIRTPMNAIVNLTNMAKSEFDNRDELENDLDRIAVSSEFLLGLINDILDMSRIENGKMELSPVVYNYNEFLNYIDGIIKPLCAQKDISFECNLGDENDFENIWVDRTRFNQIFFNILSNAVKYTEPSGHVSLYVANKKIENGNLICDFIISDNGCGIDHEFLEKTFVPFERADNTNAYTGTGLGLAITKSIIDALGGTITIKSNIGEGTTVTVHLSLPLATEKQLSECKKSPAGLSDKNLQVSDRECLKGKRILIAEDHPLNQEIIVRLLKKWAINADCVQNGKECVQRFSESEDGYYDAILMDIRMPVMDGLTASLEIRQLDSQWAKNIPIIAMTANAFTDDELASKKAGMNAHLTKPIEPNKLYGFLARYIKE